MNQSENPPLGARYFLANYTGVSLSADGGMLVTTQFDHPLNTWLWLKGDSSRAKPITSGWQRETFKTFWQVPHS